MLNVLRRRTPFSFSRIVTGDESWFWYSYQYDHMFARSRDDVIPRTKATIGAQKVMLTIFFSGVRLINLNALPPRARFTQEYFMNSILPDIANKMGRIFQRVRRRIFCAHGQFRVSRWSQGDRWTWQSGAWPSSALNDSPDLSPRLLIIRHVEASNQGSGVSCDWRDRECFSWDLRSGHFRRPAVRLL
jgi:hypothetical protein